MHKCDIVHSFTIHSIERLYKLQVVVIKQFYNNDFLSCLTSVSGSFFNIYVQCYYTKLNYKHVAYWFLLQQYTKCIHQSEK